MNADRVNKLRYRAWRRGFLEADLILGPFADRCLAELDDAGLAEFEALLDQPDPDLYAWITGQAAAPAALCGATLDLIKAFRLTAHAAREGRNVQEA